MPELWNSLVQLFDALLQLALSLGGLLVPFLPLIAWVAFWLFAVNWRKLSTVLRQGGWTGVALISFVTILVWGLVAPPADGAHHILGLTLSNYYGKLVYVTTLVCIMLLCGSVQLSGAFDCCVTFAEAPADDYGDHGHGHGDHGHGHDGHGHADHGHGDHGHGDHGHGGSHEAHAHH